MSWEWPKMRLVTLHFQQRHQCLHSFLLFTHPVWSFFTTIEDPIASDNFRKLSALIYEMLTSFSFLYLQHRDV